MKEIRIEKTIRKTLETHLQADEHLLAFSYGHIRAAVTHLSYIGLTPKRLIILPLQEGQPMNTPYTIQRAIIQKVRWMGSLRIASRLRLILPGETMDLQFAPGRWRKRAQKIATQLETNSEVLLYEQMMSTPQKLAQVEQLWHLGLLTTAEKLLDSTMANDPILYTDADTLALQNKVADSRFAYRTVGVFLLANVVLYIISNILLNLFTGGDGPESIIITSTILLILDTFIGINLLRGQAKWRPWVLFRAIVGFALYGLFMSLYRENTVNMILQAALSGSLLLIGFSPGERDRTQIAIIIYLMGFVGILIAALFAEFVIHYVGLS